MNIREHINAFNGVKALVIGDVMVDTYLWGDTDRISPESPVPVVSIREEENRLGGAANVALNIKAMGANPILCSIVGDDSPAATFRSVMDGHGLSSEGILANSSRTTTKKTRVISRGQQLIRVDRETTSTLSEEAKKQLAGHIHSLLDHHDFQVVVFQDYDKGLLSSSLIRDVVAKCSDLGIPVTVDPKKDHFFDYRNVTLFKPNLSELKLSLNKAFSADNMEDLESAILMLREKAPHKYTLVTLSDKGIYLHDGESGHHFPSHKIRQVFDVSGAGDTVISIASLGIASGMEPQSWTMLSNIAGGLVCEKVGVSPIEKEVLLEEAARNFGS